MEASADGSYTVISVRAGEGEATGNGETYDLRGGQRGTFSGTDTLYADVEQTYGPDEFDTWSEGRDHRYDYSRSSEYLSHDVVGYEDLDDYGDWRNDSNYGHVWFPNQVAEVGRPITRDIGIGFLPGAGRGSMTPRGATPRSTTDAG